MMFIASTEAQVQIHQVDVSFSELWSRVYTYVLPIAVYVFVPALNFYIMYLHSHNKPLQHCSFLSANVSS